MAKRIILDTNLWIPFLISKTYSGLDTYLQEGEVTLVFSEELFAELLAVVKRPKFKKYFSESDISSLMEMMDVFGEIVEVTSDLEICRDEKDNFLLNLAKDAKVDFIITGDKDLLVLKNLGETDIITFSHFLALINKS
jgi:hypothetical protein